MMDWGSGASTTPLSVQKGEAKGETARDDEIMGLSQGPHRQMNVKGKKPGSACSHHRKTANEEKVEKRGVFSLRRPISASEML